MFFAQSLAPFWQSTNPADSGGFFLSAFAVNTDLRLNLRILIDLHLPSALGAGCPFEKQPRTDTPSLVKLVLIMRPAKTLTPLWLPANSAFRDSLWVVHFAVCAAALYQFEVRDPIISTLVVFVVNYLPPPQNPFQMRGHDESVFKNRALSTSVWVAFGVHNYVTVAVDG